MQKKHWIIFFISIVVALSGCKKNSPSVHIKRFEQLLFSEESRQDLYGTLKANENDYRFLFNAPLEDSLYMEELKEIATDSVLHEINDTVQKYYANLSRLEKDLTKATANIRKHFPEFSITYYYTLVSYHFDYFDRVLINDSSLAISINMYVAEHFRKYGYFDLPTYMANMLNKNEILPDCISAIGYYLLTNNRREESLLDIIVTRGKILYFMDQVIPNVADNYKIRYNKEQHEWCRKNENVIWGYLLENNFLYETDFLKIRHLVNEGPRTQGFEGAPAR